MTTTLALLSSLGLWYGQACTNDGYEGVAIVNGDYQPGQPGKIVSGAYAHRAAPWYALRCVNGTIVPATSAQIEAYEHPELYKTDKVTRRSTDEIRVLSEVPTKYRKLSSDTWSEMSAQEKAAVDSAEAQATYEAALASTNALQTSVSNALSVTLRGSTPVDVVQNAAVMLLFEEINRLRANPTNVYAQYTTNAFKNAVTNRAWGMQ